MLVAGLDSITKGFQYIVGNVSLGNASASLFISAAVIFISLFALYFGMSENRKLKGNRALTWFFLHFFYLSALIVTLQGTFELFLH